MSRHWLGLLLLAVWITGGVAHATITPADDPLDLGNVVVGQSKTANTTLSADANTQNVTVVVHGGTACAEFSITAPIGPVTINSGNHVTATVKLAPSSPGPKSCAIDIVQGTTKLSSFTATGTGEAPAIHVDQVPAFSATDVGKTTSAQLRLTNSGTSPLTITSAMLTGRTDFTVSGGPTAPLAVGEQTTWDITCKPTMFGNRTDTLAIVYDAFSDSPHNVSLSCSGNQGVLATDQTAAIDFTAVPRGTTQTRTFKLSNVGSIDVSNVSLAIAPANVGYSLDTTALATLAKGGSVTITVTFKPQSKADGGPATITFTGTWGSSPTPALSLGVTGNEASYGPMPAQPAVDFGNFRFDTHPQQTFQLLNDGNASLDMTASFAPDTGTGATEYKVELANGTVTLAPPVTLTADDHVTVVVSPQVQAHVGLVSGHIDITPSVGAPLRVPVTGVATAAGVEFPATVSFGVVDLDQPPAIQTIAIKNTSDGALDVTSITVLPVPGPSARSSDAFAIALPSTPAHLAPGASLAIPVTYHPAVATAGGSDVVDLSAQLAGSLDLALSIQISGEAVFSEVYGGGGCDAGAGRSGGFVIALAALLVLRRRRRLVIVTAASIAIAPAVRADGVGLTVFAPTPAITGEGIALQVPDVGARGSWAANAVVSYASNPLLIDSVSGDGSRVTRALVERSTLLQLGAAYALLDRFELGARLPLYLQSGEAGVIGQAVHGTALGDLALHAKARLWRGGTGAGAVAAGGSAIVMLPTASKDQFTGSNQPEARLLLLGSFTPAALESRLALSVNAGAVLRGTSSYANIEQRSGIAWGGGASVRIVPRLWATAELFGELTPSARHPEPMPGAMASPVTLSQIEGLAGVSIKPDRRFTVGLALGRGMTSAPGTPELRGVLSLSVVPGAAPAEPIHPHVLDVAPVADADTDGDGIIDRLDQCPREPEDKDGFQDADGCPDPDNDGDGIPDAQDRCPNDPEDKDGFQDADGCPDPDNDGDGIPDVLDKCPDVPETVNGFQDDDGCPDSLPAVVPPSTTGAAEASFAKGRELMAKNHYAAACAAFEHSQQLDPQYGTQYNLAICYNKLGKLATAWNLYREVARGDTNPARRGRAGQLAAALTRRVPKLRLVLSNHPDGVQVLLNGVDASALIGIDAPVDAGQYTVAATAAGYRLWQSTVQAQDSRVITVVIDLHPFP